MTAARICQGCGEVFEPALPSHHYCRRCAWRSPVTSSQKAYLLALSKLLRIEPPTCKSSTDAVRAIDRLLRRAEDDPDVHRCVAVGCRLLIQGPSSHCPRHRPHHHAPTER